MNNMKTWSAPKLYIHGGLESLTNQVKPKQLGSSDDFGISGISDP